MPRALFALVLLAASGAAAAQAPGVGDVVINEIMYDPPTGGASNEWVEIMNRSAQAVEIGTLRLSDGGDASGTLPAGATLAPGAFAVLVRNPDAFAAAYPGVAFFEIGGFPTLNNTGDRLALLEGTTEIDVVPYRRDWGGTDASLERVSPTGPSDEASNWATTVDPAAGTPGAVNSVFAPDEEPPGIAAVAAETASSVVVTFDEPVDPATAETASNYSISDGIGAPSSAEVLDDDPARVRLTLAVPLSGPAVYTLTVTGVADPAGNGIATATATFAFGDADAPGPRDLVINEFLYDEPSADNPGEYVELFNRTERTFDLADLTLNDGTGDDEPITDSPTFVLPGAYAVIVEDGGLFAAQFPGVPFVEQPAWSALNNSGDAVVLKLGDTVLDSLRYAPSWGGEDASLERKDPEGPSSVAINWATTTDLRGGTPGEINSVFAPDEEGPVLVEAVASRDGLRIVVTLSEPVVAATLTPGAFALSGGVAVASIEAYDAGVPQVVLVLSARLPDGSTTITASGLTDLVGNTSATSSVDVTFEPDTTAPVIVRAAAASALVVRVTFSEPVTDATALAAGTYTLSDGVGAPASVSAVERESDPTGLSGVAVAELTFASPLAERVLYTLTASGLEDLAGNVQPPTSARVFFGAADTPSRGSIAITEIMYDPRNGSDGEYVELLNLSDGEIYDLRGLSLADDGDALSDEPAFLLPGEHLAVVRDAAGFAATFPGVPFAEVGSEVSLSNSGETLVLRAGEALIDSVAYDPDWHRVELDDATGVALERRDPRGPASAATNWSSSLAEAGGTPSATNSIGVSFAPEPDAGGLSIPGPFDADREAVEIGFELTTEAALVRVRIYDMGGRVVRELVPGRLSGARGTVQWDGRDGAGERLRVGPYVVLLEALDGEGGSTEAHKGVVVLARPL